MRFSALPSPHLYCVVGSAGRVRIRCGGGRWRGAVRVEGVEKEGGMERGGRVEGIEKKSGMERGGWREKLIEGVGKESGKTRRGGKCGGAD